MRKNVIFHCCFYVPQNSCTFFVWPSSRHWRSPHSCRHFRVSVPNFESKLQSKILFIRWKREKMDEIGRRTLSGRERISSWLHWLVIHGEFRSTRCADVLCVLIVWRECANSKNRLFQRLHGEKRRGKEETANSWKLSAERMSSIMLTIRTFVARRVPQSITDVTEACNKNAALRERRIVSISKKHFHDSNPSHTRTQRLIAILYVNCFYV